MRGFLTLLAFMLPLALAFASPALAERRALVIGNADYDEAPDLFNTLSDAAAYAETFRAIGYEVTLEEDLDRDGLELAVALFTDQIQPGDDAIFVFSGHGWSDGSINYLLPTDIPTSASKKLTQLRSMPLQNGVNGVLDQMKAAGASLQVAVIDACRNNIFDPQGTKSFGQTRGLSRVQPAEGAFVIFSAGAGQTALDRLPSDSGTGLSVFTRTFLPHLRSGKPLLRAMKAAQQETVVLARSIGHPQRPAFYDETLGDVCLSGTCATPAVQRDLCADARDVWSDVKDIGSAAILKDFSAKYAQCPIYSGLAQAALTRLAPEPSDPEVEVSEPEPIDIVEDAAPADTGEKGFTPAEKICLTHAAPPATVPLIEGVALEDIKTNTALAACERALAQGSDRLEIYHAQGRVHYALKDYELARARFAEPAARGYVPSKTSLGALYFNGLGGARDYPRAYELFEETAQAGDSLGLFYRGFARQQGRGTGVSNPEAGADFLAAIRRGNQFAMDNLAVIKPGALKAMQTVLKREGHYKSAVDGKLGPGTRVALRKIFGSLPAQGELRLPSTNRDDDFEKGLALVTAQGEARDVPTGLGLLRLAAEAGHAQAQTEVGKIYTDGRLARRNDALAATYFRRAIAQGNAEAHFHMGQLHEYGRTVKKSAPLAAEFYYLALEKGDDSAIREAQFISVDVMGELQTKLRAGGFYNGPIDGRTGPETLAGMQVLLATN